MKQVPTSDNNLINWRTRNNSAVLGENVKVVAIAIATIPPLKGGWLPCPRGAQCSL